MPSKIRVLTEQTINQIAAGEVIENPASVVKELVENSIDAGSTEITVEIRAGGRQLIRISDNGCGMSRDDAVLSLERHATSKIRHLDDLNELHTMGFRGEAIPSIASISKMTIMTRPEEEEVGTLIMVEGGRMLSCAPAARSKGTTIEIKSLFFNVPVRKKFQKSPAYDVQEIQKMLNLIALANPKIKFELINNEEIVFKATPSQADNQIGELKERIEAVLGTTFILDALPIEQNKGSYQLIGFLGSPFHHRPNRTGQYLFINGRPIQSSALAYAIREGYGMTLPPNRYPSFVIYLTLPGEDVDVNVHPQKKEVRFSKEQQLREMVIKGVENVLSGSVHPFLQMSTETVELPAFLPEPIHIPAPPPLPRPISSFIPSPAPKPPPVQMEIPQTYVRGNTLPTAKVLAIIQGYVLVDPACFPKNREGGLCLVDPQAAQSRIIFESLISKNETPETQSLLVPYTVDLTPSESILLMSKLDYLQSLGFHIREFGNNTFMVDQIPIFLKDVDVVKLIKEFVAEFQENTKGVQQDLRRRLALAACRMAKKNSDHLNAGSAQLIVDKLLRCDNPYQSPFGKPTLAHITPEELAGKFQK